MRLILAIREDAERVNHLRIEAYQNANGTVLRDFDFLRWSSADDQACILCIEDDHGNLIASVRVMQLNTLAELESMCDCRLTTPLPLPTLYFDKLVALVEHRQKRLSMLFRLLIIEAAMNSGIQSFSFTINESAQRIPLMKKMGYQFSPADTSHRSDDNVFDNSVDVLVASLHFSLFPSALMQGRKEQIVTLEDVALDDKLANDLHGALRNAWSKKILAPA